MPRAKKGLEYKPHNGVAPHFKGQTRLHEARASGKKRIVAHVGRRWGKGRFAIGDMMACYRTALREKRGSELVPRFHAVVLVPTFPQGRQPWHELMALVPSEWKLKTENAERMIWLKDLLGNWGGAAGLIEMKSSFEPDSLQGFGCDYLWINEAQDVPDEAYEIILPTTRSHGVLGWQYYEGIPPTYPDHWFHKALLNRSENPAYFSFTATSFDNPLLSKEHRAEIESDRDEITTIAWERLYLAQYSQNAGFFHGIDACIAGELLHGPIPGSRYVGGLDPGWTNDPTVFILMDADQRKIVQYWEWDGSLSMVEKRERIENIHREWNIENIVFDASSGGGVAVAQDFETTALPVEPLAIVGVRRKELLEHLAGAIDRGTISFPSIRPLLRQLRAMQEIKHKSGMFRLGVPSGEHDDYIFALALALGACVDAAPVRNLTPLRSKRYIQTQAEANGATKSDKIGPRLMRERKMEGIRQRAIIAGVET